jgi:tetratricopeptide (TPR) repeat protein
LLSVSKAAQAQTPDPESLPAATLQEAYQAAIEELDRAEQVDPTELRTEALTEVNRRVVAVQGADPNHPRLPYLYGRLYALTGRRGDAIDQLRRFVESREGRSDWESHRRLGDLFIEEFPRLAQGSYERAAELKPGEPTVLAGLSLAAYKVGRIDDALRLAKEAADADGRKTVRIVSHLARMFIAKQQWADAQRAGEQAMELAKGDVKAQPGARRPLSVLDSQYQLAIDLLQARVNEKVAGTDDFLKLAAYVRQRNDLIRRINLHEVLRVLESGVKATAPATPTRLLLEYAVTLADVGRKDEAIATLEKLLAADPTNAAAQEQLDRLKTPAAANER